MSSHCQQKIHHECDNNPLTGASSWTDINNNKNHYWHGGHESSHTGCACSRDNSCNSTINGNFKCACDTFAMNAIDVGILTGIKKLPVMKLHYGGSINSWSKITYQLDALICSGKSGYYPSEAAKVKYESLQNKDNLLHKKVHNLENNLARAVNETQKIKLTTEEKIQNLTESTKESIETMQLEQRTLFNETVETLESQIGNVKPKRAGFRWTGMQSRSGDPSKFRFVYFCKHIMNFKLLGKRRISI